MIQVIKRSGAAEPFNIEKIRTSLACISDDIEQSLNESDLKGITRDVEEIIEGKTTVNTRQIYIIVIGVLAARGFWNIIKRYMGHESNSWR